jgi:hypothetical protein
MVGPWNRKSVLGDRAELKVIRERVRTKNHDRQSGACYFVGIALDDMMARSNVG